MTDYMVHVEIDINNDKCNWATKDKSIAEKLFKKAVKESTDGTIKNVKAVYLILWKGTQKIIVDKHVLIPEKPKQLSLFEVGVYD